MDSGGLPLGTDAESDLIAPTKSWVERQFSAAVPVGTRTIRLKLRGQRGAGTNNDADFDSVTADLLLYGSGVGSLPPVLATWRFQVPTSEAYEVYAKWPESAGHASDAGYRIFHAAGASTAVVKSQRQGGGQWTRLGRFDFEAGREHWIELSDQGDGGVVADAIYVVKAAQSYDSYSWAPGLPSAGDYAVYAKWAADAGRASDAVYGIYHAGGLAEVAQDQRAGAGQWAYLGTWAFDPAGSPLVVLAGGSDGTLSADALRFVGAGPAPADLRFVLGDHLGTPQKLTDNTGALVWDRIQTPFGLDHSVTGAAATPVRFPGQYADGESALHYNYFRDYDPSLGRYVESDPIGLAGGLALYLYAEANSLRFVDPFGLQSFPPPPPKIPGGPWKWAPNPENSRGGTFRDPKNKEASWDAKDSHWDVDDGQGNRQRYDRWGNPLTPEEAHGYTGPRQKPIDFSRMRLIGKCIPFLGALGDALWLYNLYKACDNDPCCGQPHCA